MSFHRIKFRLLKKCYCRKRVGKKVADPITAGVMALARHSWCERKKRWWRVGEGEGGGGAVKKFTISPATPADCFPPFSLK
jgi:hypothetical protein